MIKIGDSPSGLNWIGVTVTNMFLKNIVTGELTDINSSIVNSKIIHINGTCSCSGILLEVNIIIN